MSSSSQPDLVLLAGTVFTATDQEALLSDAWVHVVEGKIASISASEPRASAGAVRIVDPRATLLPGLIDCHVHLSAGGRPDFLAEWQEPFALACISAVQYARQTLLAGFTSVRTVGGRDGLELALRDAQAQGKIDGPRIRTANRMICMTGGHGNRLGGREADGPEEVRRAVREQLKAGADCIKLVATGGVMTQGVEPGAEQLTFEELKAGIDEAHKASRKVACHAQGEAGINASVRAGTDSVEHGIYVSDDAIERMKEQGTFMSPTFAAAALFSNAPQGTVPDWAREKSQRVAAIHRERMKRAYEAGVRFVTSTDAGTPLNYHGANAYELELMVQNGMDPLDVLRAATRNGAELLGLQDQVGQIEVGMEADLVLCRGNVVQDVACLGRPGQIQAVIQAGRVYRPDGEGRVA